MVYLVVVKDTWGLRDDIGTVKADKADKIKRAREDAKEYQKKYGGVYHQKKFGAYVKVKYGTILFYGE